MRSLVVDREQASTGWNGPLRRPKSTVLFNRTRPGTLSTWPMVGAGRRRSSRNSRVCLVHHCRSRCHVQGSIHRSLVCPQFTVLDPQRWAQSEWTRTTATKRKTFLLNAFLLTLYPIYFILTIMIVFSILHPLFFVFYSNHILEHKVQYVTIVTAWPTLTIYKECLHPSINESFLVINGVIVTFCYIFVVLILCHG